MHHSDRASASLRSLFALVLPGVGALTLAACSSGEIVDPADQPDGTCQDGACADDGADGTGADDDDGSPGAGLTPPQPTSGSVAVTLHPGESAAIGNPTVVSFGAPFPPGALADVALLRATDASGHELPIHAAELLPWRVWPGHSGTPSVRAARVSVEVTFAERAPLEIQLEIGAAPDAHLPAPDDPRAGWVDVTDGEYPAGTVREPPVYAAFTAEWLGACQLHTRTTPVGSDPAWDWLDQSFLGSAHTAVNDVPSSVSDAERVPYTSDYEPWLFDRAATLFSAYTRTSDVDWLRRAHRAAQFYAAHVDGAGYFDLKEDPDLKYSYGRSLVLDLALTGDDDLVPVIERIAAAGKEWDPTYDLDTNFWTERHQAYALLAALSAWEATGDEQHAARADQIAEVSFAMAADPAGSWQAEGCTLHGMTAHEGAGGDVPVCSPWMSALFADAVWAYYIQTGADDALGFLAGLGHFVADYGLYPGGEGIDLTLPWYLASNEETFSDDGPWGDVEHTCDVAGLVARAAWAEKQLGHDPAELRATAEQLIEGCQWDLDMWHRPDAPAAGKTEWRLSPPRKFNWWFGTTSDLPWLMSETK